MCRHTYQPTREDAEGESDKGSARLPRLVKFLKSQMRSHVHVKILKSHMKLLKSQIEILKSQMQLLKSYVNFVKSLLHSHLQVKFVKSLLHSDLHSQLSRG